MITVLGCGVSGLSCALLLARAGHRVRIWTSQTPPHTTSNVAAAFWYPYRAFPIDRVTRWARGSYQHFASLAGETGTGITMRDAFDFYRAAAKRPWWADAVPALRQAHADELPAGFVFGWAFRAPVVDTRAYLPFLQAQLKAAGIEVRTRHLRSVDELRSAGPLVVNCTGLGAGQLFGDDQVFPIRGQLVRVSNPGLERVLLDEHEPGRIAYVVPRGDDCVLGGTASERDDDLDVRPQETEEVLKRCSALAPELRTAKRLADVVGLRPGRREVRLESEMLPSGIQVVHNYGHGGAGVTLSWGCAQEVATHVAAATERSA